MFPMMAQTNPMMDMWMKSLQGAMPQLPNVCQPAVQNPMAQMQQAMQMWQNMLTPQAVQPAASTFPAPKITVMTIELGDMKPYMEAASQMLAMWQPQLSKMMMPR